MGDFNAMRFGHEKIGGSYRWRNYILDLNSMCNETWLEDLWFMGNFFTWSNMREGEHRITTKIDRALMNERWGNVFGNSIANFLPKSILDHSPCIVECGVMSSPRKIPLLVRLGKKKLGVPLCINWLLN